MASSSDTDVVCLTDFEKLSEKKMSPSAWDYIRSGADDQRTLEDNIEAFKRSVTVV